VLWEGRSLLVLRWFVDEGSERRTMRIAAMSTLGFGGVSTSVTTGPVKSTANAKSGAGRMRDLLFLAAVVGML
jgi:hypothetical protein